MIYNIDMTPEQQQHFEQLMHALIPLAKNKYELGAKEHQTLLSDLTDEQLFMAETEEIIDLLHYRLTRILKRLD